MITNSERIQELLGTTPEPLIEYYDSRKQFTVSDLGINLLSLEEAYEYTKSIGYLAPAEELGLWVLDDANDSNPFCFISKGPCAGAVLHLCHDDNSTIRFGSIETFLSSLSSIKESGEHIDLIRSETNLSFELSNEIERLVAEDTELSVYLICTYLPVCVSLSEKAKKGLARNEDFYAREAFALWIQRTANLEDLEFAASLASDSHMQVSRPGKLAKSAINKKKYGG